MPPASFRFHLTTFGDGQNVDTLAIGYVIPAISAHSGLAPVRQCSCRAYYESRSGIYINRAAAFFDFREGMQCEGGNVTIFQPHPTPLLLFPTGYLQGISTLLPFHEGWYDADGTDGASGIEVGCASTCEVELGGAETVVAVDDAEDEFGTVEAGLDVGTPVAAVRAVIEVVGVHEAASGKEDTL